MSILDTVQTIGSRVGQAGAILAGGGGGMIAASGRAHTVQEALTVFGEVWEAMK